MNTVRWLTLFACIVSASLKLWAQNPILQLERSGRDEGDLWTGRTAIEFRLTVLHPAMRRGGIEDEFVVDPPGGWRSALQLFVTDAAGKPVDWSFVNTGKDVDQPLCLN